MIGTKFLNGQGLGNQLFCYVSSRCIASDLHVDFCSEGKEFFSRNIHNQHGMYFMDIDLGKDVDENAQMFVYHERDDRLYLWSSFHDVVNGCYVSAIDNDMYTIADNTILLGNMQSEYYFVHHKDEVKKWLAVKAEYENYELTSDDICVMNIRGGEYVGNHELFLPRHYWLNAMANMRMINSKMSFVIVSDDIATAKRMFPYLPVFHFDLAGDYVRIKNARYLIVSNSSFAFFPVFCSETLKYVIAPKYWARHNVSNGFWASAQNIYDGWHYQDRAGLLFSASECRKELSEYIIKKRFMTKINKRSFINKLCLSERNTLRQIYRISSKITSVWRNGL